MRLLMLIPLCLCLGACSKGVLGVSSGECDKNPESCSSVRQAQKNSNGNITPVPSEAALQRGDVMRVWVAPMRMQTGVLTNSGHVYLE